MAAPRAVVKRGFYRGDVGRAKADEELKLAKARAEAAKEAGNQPFRFRVAQGNSTEFVVLDDEPDFYRFEHNLKNPATGYWDIHTGCVKEWANCPVCMTVGKESTYCLYLSVLDFTPFDTKDGVTHEFSRKLLVVKPAQQKKFLRAFARAEQEGRTLRGAVFATSRDGEKDPTIGNDIEFIEYMEEDALVGYVRSWKDKEGKKHTEDCSVPYNYEELFEEPTEEALRAQVGAPAPLGNKRANDRALRGAPDAPVSPVARTRRAPPPADDAGNEQEGDWQPPAASTRMGRRAAVARGGDDLPDDENLIQDEPARRPAPRTAVRGGRAAPPPPEEGYDDTPPAPAPRGRLGARREDPPAPRAGAARAMPGEGRRLVRRG